MLHQCSLWLHGLSTAGCAFARGSAQQFGVGSSVAVLGAVSWHTLHAHRPGLLGCTGMLVPAAPGVRPSPGTNVQGGGILTMPLWVMPVGAGANPCARDQGLPSTIAHVAEGVCW